MSTDGKKENSKSPADEDSAADPVSDQSGPDPVQNGPKFTKGPDPLAGVKKGATEVLASMEGKTVSMKVYVGTIVGVIILMLLARCGG